MYQAWVWNEAKPDILNSPPPPHYLFLQGFIAGQLDTVGLAHSGILECVFLL